MNEIFMRRALKLAKKADGKVSPNPLVGCVIVKNGKIIGEGYHMEYGGNHAEVNAILNTNTSVEGSCMYVTLEPCSHYGNTPPCAKRIVEEKIEKVVIGMKDPNPKVCGQGIKILKEAGIKVEMSSLGYECERLNEKFIKYITTKKPFVALKWASTLDGKIATKTKNSQWISNEKSRAYVHKLRNSYKGILVGVNTVIEDNPRLTCRIENGINPIRVILDTNGRTPLDSEVFKVNGKTIMLVRENLIRELEEKFKNVNASIIGCRTKNGRIELNNALVKLGEIGIDSLLIEGGGTVNASFLQENLVDKIYTFIAPKIIGGEGLNSIDSLGINMVSESVKLNIGKVEQFDNDIFIESYVQKEE